MNMLAPSSSIGFIEGGPLILEEAKNLVDKAKITIEQKSYNVIILGLIITDLLSETEFSDDFFAKFTIYNTFLNSYFCDQKLKIVFTDLRHILQTENYSDELFYVLKEYDVSLIQNFKDRTARVKRYHDLLLGFNAGINRTVGINEFLCDITNKCNEKGIKVTVNGDFNNQGQVNSFFTDIIIDNLLTNYDRYGTDGKLEIAFYPQSFDMLMHNDKKPATCIGGTGKGTGIMKSATEEVFGGHMSIDDDENNYYIKFQDLNYN